MNPPPLTTQQLLPQKRGRDSSRASDNPDLRDVRHMILNVSDSERYVMVEDLETGDVLIPLLYMKQVFVANYSRKLASLKHRIVVLPHDNGRGSSSLGPLYWQW